MIKPNTPNPPGMPGFPGMGSMTDTLEFVKNLWGGMGLPGASPSAMQMPGMQGMPGMVVPTLSVEEIRKKISDLRAVQTWLELNMNMLRGTIQALEVQAATISTLQSMGEAFNATMNSASGQPQAEAKRSEPATPSSSAEQTDRSSGPTTKDQEDAASLTAPLVNAAAWWNMLQDQFKQAVNNAMVPEQTPEATPPEAGSASNGASTPARKRKPTK
ncbi:MAG: hypothetical protein JWQ00_2032 [Noviherbaspirillum sp.]|nr:hypothetical protein [Noviherbaspirillum sp.]